MKNKEIWRIWLKGDNVEILIKLKLCFLSIYYNY